MRARLLNSFLGVVDLKLGSSVITLLGVLNKVAGLYGLVSLLAASLTLSQISLYIYSLVTLIIFLWGLKGIAEENPLTILNYAHLFALDHFIGTTYTVFFGVIWWVYHPHDGKREVHSDAQREILEKSAHPSNLDPEQQRLAAQTIWTSERGFSLVVLCGSWLIKIYFILCIYSFALHLRRGSYRHLAASASGANKSASPAPASQARRRSAQYVYSHVRNDSRASEGVEDESESLELERVDVSQSLARPPIPKLEEVPPSPADTAPASTDPALQFVKGSPVTSTVAFGVAAPTLMRSRSASDTKSDAMA